MSRSRVAVLTPLPPQKTGIASYCAALLPALATHLDFTTVVPDWVVGLTSTTSEVPVIGLSEYLRSGGFDLAVYHMGNHPFFHGWIHHQLLDRPGVVVLHDLDLAGFYSYHSLHHPEDLCPPHEASDVNASHGPALPTLATVIEASLAVVVHSEPLAVTLRARHPTTPIFAVPLAGIRTAVTIDRASIRSALGWDDHVVFAALGGIATHKRIDLVLRAFASASRLQPSALLLIAGWPSDPNVLDELESLGREQGITAALRFALDLPPEDFAMCCEAADCLVDLRDDQTGATPSMLMNALAAGMPAIVTDLPSNLGSTEGHLMRVPREPRDAIPRAAEAMRSVLRDIAELRAGRSARVAAFSDGPAALDRVAATHAQVIISTLRSLRTDVTLGASVRLPRWTRSERVTVVGDLTATTGLMEFGRSLAQILETTGVGLDHFHHACLGASHSDTRDPTGLNQRLPRRREALLELWLPNINEFPLIPDELLRPPGPSRRVIASWFWELPVFEERYRSQLSRVDEIWTGSPFIARSISAYRDLPVTVIPYPLVVTVPDRVGRREFGIPEERLVFFFDFDANSTTGRKNPAGLIDAFERAFSGHNCSPAPLLVVKVSNARASHNYGVVESLRRRLEPLGGIVVDDELTRLEMNALICAIDIYASMHRSEGLGLGMLEAMYLAKPVISPAYPHKWLFSLADAGIAVRSPLKEIEASDHALGSELSGVYEPGLPWTEPVASDAATWMRALADDPKLRALLGQRQARLVREHYNARRAAQTMLDRLAVHVGVEDPSEVDRIAAGGQ
jgi:glycosyltransferase involved in cell wall biosynthesis